MKVTYTCKDNYERQLMVDDKIVGRAFKAEFTAKIMENDLVVIHAHPEITELVTETDQVFMIVGDRKFRVVEVVA